MINCLLVDDEQAAIDVLKYHINKVTYLNYVGETTQPMEVIKLLQIKKVDLIFLDVQMPDISGIELLKSINSNAKVIFTTAYSEYALDGYELDVIDFLLKPVSLPRFIKAVEKARNLLTNSNINAKENRSQNQNYIYVKTELKGKLVKIGFDEIDFVEGMKNYVAIHRGAERIMALLNLKDIEDELPQTLFIRIHKSFIINTDKIASVEGQIVFLKNQSKEIPLGDSFKTVFLNAIREKVL